MTPLPPKRPPQAELDALAKPPAPAPAAPAAVAPAAAAPQAAPQQGGNILDEIGAFLESIFGGSGGASERPGYEWDALQGWVPTAGKDNAGMMQAAQAALTPPAAPDQPKVPVAATAATTPKKQLPVPNNGMAGQPYELPPVSLDSAMLSGSASGSPGRFR